MESKEWDVRVVIGRALGAAKKQVSEEEVRELLDALAAKARETELRVTAGRPQAKAVNCPKCGYLVRSVSQDKCFMCGARW